MEGSWAGSQCWRRRVGVGRGRDRWAGPDAGRDIGRVVGPGVTSRTAKFPLVGYFT
ncbi:hypothetical protein STTU_3788 [Streptomyces sp. Tu6071]|nr:hypothetical protein STTU_3788 [Streptomyces sp. Tu6071]